MNNVSDTRVFVGIPISPEGVSEILRDHPLLKDLPVRWIRDEDLHITLLPPWYTKNVEQEIEKLSLLTSLSSFPLFFHSIESVPVRMPRVLWVRGDAPPFLFHLKKTVEELFKKTPENRPFTPHVTIARFTPPEKLYNTNPIREPFSWEVMVGEVCLYESHMSSAGAWYEKRGRVKLK